MEMPVTGRCILIPELTMDMDHSPDHGFLTTATKLLQEQSGYRTENEREDLPDLQWP